MNTFQHPVITVPNPDDLDGTDLPIFEGNLTGAAAALTDGTYLATRQTFTEDGDPLAPLDGTLTVFDGVATFRPFSRVPSVIVGQRDTDGDLWCDSDCPSLDGAEDGGPTFEGPATLADLPDFFAPECVGCGRVLIDYDEVGAAADVTLVVLAATGIVGDDCVPTGGGCTAFIADLPDGREVWVTCGDASRPDGIGMVAAVRDRSGEGDWSDEVLFEGEEGKIAAPHDPVRLYRTLRARLATTEG